MISTESDAGQTFIADSRWSRLFARKLEVETVEAVRYFRSHGIEPILIKGWAAARYYPVDDPRIYYDVDLAVSRSDFQRASEIIKAADGRLAVDLHDELRHLDKKPWRAVVTDSILTELDGCPVRVPSDEDHLRILATHWLNDGGQHKARLYDIYYTIERRGRDIDWEKCFAEIPTNRQYWIIAAVGLAHRYLGLSLEGLPFESEAKDLPGWLTSTVEREWADNTPLRSLSISLDDPREFIKQVRKRLPPNPIQATIEMDGDLRARSRLPYQLGTMRRRVGNSILNLSTKLGRRFR